MTDKSQALIDELVAACIAFGRQVEPDWQTRIEKAQRELREYIDELEAEIERLTVHSDIERQDDKCSGHGDISNFPPVMGSGDGLGW